MVKLGSAALTLAASAVLLLGSSVSADTAPNPPPGVVSVQPASVTAGSSSQPESNAGVSTGNAGASNNGDGTNAGHCGVQARAAGSGSSAQPTKVGTAGTSTPSGCSATSAPGSGATVTNASGAGVSSAGSSRQTQNADATNNGIPGTTLAAAANVARGQAVNLGFLFGLLLLLILLLLLAGYAVGRRRPVRSSA